MGAPFPTPTVRPDDTRAYLATFREEIDANLALAAVQIECARLYASLGDDRGLAYALRCFGAYSKAAYTLFGDLVEAKNGKGVAHGV